MTLDGIEIDFSTWKEMDVPPPPAAVRIGTGKVKEKRLEEVKEEKAGKVEEKKAAGGKKQKGEEGKKKDTEKRKKAKEERERSLGGWNMVMEERERAMEERRNAAHQRKEADEEENIVAAPHSTPPTRIIGDLGRILYPDGIIGPRPELNVNSKKGKFM